eukprot:711192-Pyramimonas_sp.AAC.1
MQWTTERRVGERVGVTGEAVVESVLRQSHEGSVLRGGLDRQLYSEQCRGSGCRIGPPPKIGAPL